MTEGEIKDEIKKEIEHVADKIRADSAESRLKHLMSLVVFLGLGVPLVISIYSQLQVQSVLKENREEVRRVRGEMEGNLASAISSMKSDIEKTKQDVSNTVNNSINSMNNNFSELVKNQRRKPILTALFGNKKLDGLTIPYKSSDNEENGNQIIIYNSGNATAKNVRIIFYGNHLECIYFRTEEYQLGHYSQLNISTEERFHQYTQLSLGDIDIGEKKPIYLGGTNCETNVKNDTLYLMIRCVEQSPVSQEFIIQLQ